MENPRPEKETINEDTRNLFRLEKETKAIKDIILRNSILRDIKNLFEHKEKENHYNPVTVSNFWSNNHIEYKCNSDRSKTLSAKEYLKKSDT